MSKALNEEVRRLAEAMVAGKLDERGSLSGLSLQDAEAVRLINGMIDALVAPMRLAGNALDEIAHGNLPPFVIDEYQGEFGRIRQSINSLLAILYGMHGEMNHLIQAVGEGKLRTRGNDWDYEGIWRELIAGVNSSLDAVIAPITEAGQVLDRLAHYDLRARMSGKYRGDHALIRKAINSTAESLHEAIAQVSEAVGLVSQVGSQMAQVSFSVAQGAEEQSRQLSETTVSLSQLSQKAGDSARHSRIAHGKARQATDAVLSVKESMSRMVSSMDEINRAAERTATVAGEIDAIARETGTLAGSTVEKAVRMRTSAGGFGVVAQEIRKLSTLCSETATAMQELAQQMESEHRERCEGLIVDLLKIARFSKFLGVNAAVEAAHVEGAGNDFKVMTDEIQNLAVRAAGAARTTGSLTTSSAELSRSGVALSREIDQKLDQAVLGASAIAAFADEIIADIQDQTTGLEQISSTARLITGVTEKNASGAAESLQAAKGLESQMDKLSRMVNRFTCSAAAPE